MVTCDSCGSENRDTFAFCGSCGEKLPLTVARLLSEHQLQAHQESFASNHINSLSELEELSDGDLSELGLSTMECVRLRKALVEASDLADHSLAPATNSALSGPEGKKERAAMYRSFLRTEGYEAELDKDGDVAFTVEGRHYIILVDEEDPEFFRLIFPNFWSIDSNEERLKTALAAVYATAKTKVAKVFQAGDNMWASIEMFISPPHAVKPVLKRALGALETSVDHFKQAMSQ